MQGTGARWARWVGAVAVVFALAASSARAQRNDGDEEKSADPKDGGGRGNSIFDFGRDSEPAGGGSAPPVGGGGPRLRLPRAASPSPAGLRAAEKYFKRGREVAAKVPDPKDGIQAFLVIARGQVAVGDYDGARETYGLVRASEGFDDAHPEALEINASAGAFDAARATLDTAKSPFDPDLRLSILAREQARAGDLADALATARGMANPDLWFAHRQIARAADPASRDALADLWKAEPAGPFRDGGLAWLASVAARAGDVKWAVEVAGAIGDGQRKAQAMIEIADAQARAGDVPAAVATVRGALPDRAAADARLLEMASTMIATPQQLRLAKALAAAAGEASPPTWACARLAVALAETGDVAAARAMLGRCAEKQSPYYRVALATTEAADGKMPAALRAARAIEGAEHLGMRNRAFHGILRAHLRRGDIPAAKRTLSSFKIAPGGLDERGPALVAIVEAQAAARDYDGARATLAMFDRMGKHSRTEAVAHLAGQQAAAGDIAAARAWVAELLAGPQPYGGAYAACLVASVAVREPKDVAALEPWLRSLHAHPMAAVKAYVGVAGGLTGRASAVNRSWDMGVGWDD